MGQIKSLFDQFLTYFLRSRGGFTEVWGLISQNMTTVGDPFLKADEGRFPQQGSRWVKRRGSFASFAIFGGN
eukprot:6464707-Amphidinium_carterae.1